MSGSTETGLVFVKPNGEWLVGSYDDLTDPARTAPITYSTSLAASLFFSVESESEARNLLSTQTSGITQPEIDSLIAVVVVRSVSYAIQGTMNVPVLDAPDTQDTGNGQTSQAVQGELDKNAKDKGEQ